MKRSKFTEAQIAFVLRQGDEGTAIGEVCRKAGISEATYYNWRKKYGGLLPSEIKRLRQLEEENGELKKIVADLSLDGANRPSRRSSTCWKVEEVPISGTNCFGIFSRDTGHSRVPAPPHKMTGTTS